MALSAGRVGVNKKSVDVYGNVKNSGSALPVASSEVLGGVKVGSGLNITEDGVLSSAGGTLYMHTIRCILASQAGSLLFTIINDQPTMTDAEVNTYMLNHTNMRFVANGIFGSGAGTDYNGKPIYGIQAKSDGTVSAISLTYGSIQAPTFSIVGYSHESVIEL